MKTKKLIILVAIMAGIITVVLLAQPRRVSDMQLSKQDSAYIFTSDSNWVKTADSGNAQPMYCERRVGYGPAVKIKIFRAGNLREVYRKYYSKYDTVSYDPIDSVMNLELRSRSVQPGEYWVIAAASTYLDDQLIRLENDGDHYYGSPTPEEIKDPAWAPKSYQATFTSLSKLDDYAKKNNSWLVICSKQTVDLLGWMYEPKKCYQLKIQGKTLPVLELESWGKEKVEWGGLHIHYRYLCIGWGGRDIEYGPGVSAFNMKNANDPESLESDDFVSVDKQGNGYWFGEKIKDFSLKDFEGI